MSKFSSFLDSNNFPDDESENQSNFQSEGKFSEFSDDQNDFDKRLDEESGLESKESSKKHLSDDDKSESDDVIVLDFEIENSISSEDDDEEDQSLFDLDDLESDEFLPEDDVLEEDDNTLIFSQGETFEDVLTKALSAGFFGDLPEDDHADYSKNRADRQKKKSKTKNESSETRNSEKETITISHFFSVEEAVLCIPKVKTLLSETRKALYPIKDEIIFSKRLLQSRQNAGKSITDEDVLVLKKKLIAYEKMLSAWIKRFAEQGFLLKDVESGLVDFPYKSKSKNALYFLCWHPPEEGIFFFHKPEEGYRERHPITLLPE
ncbi:MAG: DUF2203 family protein [Cyanobacteria bacterium P01_H01_bin.74]